MDELERLKALLDEAGIATAEDPATMIQQLEQLRGQAPRYRPRAPVAAQDSRVHNPAEPVEVQGLAELQAIGRAARRTGQQLVKGALNIPTAMYQIGAIPAALAELGLTATGVTESAPVTETLMGLAGRSAQNAERLSGVGEPENIGEETAANLALSAVPAGRLTAPLTAGLALITSLLPEPGSQDAQAQEPAQAQDAAQAAINPQDTASDDGEVLETAGGPQRVSRDELQTLGILGAATIGAIFAPSIARRVFAGRLPRLRSVMDAEPQTQAISNLGDFMRTGDDINAGALRLARRAGVPPNVIASLENTFRIQTRAGAAQLGEAAIAMGRAETPTLMFRVNTPLRDLNRLDNAEVSGYLHLRDTMDDFLAQQRLGPQAQPRTVIRGLTEQQVLQQINAMERANPQLRLISQQFRENTREVRRFAATGEYAVMTRAEQRQMNAEHAHEVPFPGGRVLDDPNAHRGSATVALAEHARRMIRERLENEARGRFIDAMRQALPNSFRQITARQARENPHWAKNTVTIYRRGQPERYTTDPFLADVLRMDPYFFTSGPGAMIYGAKRLLEQTTTGIMAPWFAVTNAIRGYQIGKQVAGPGTGLHAPTIMGTVAAIPQQIVPRLAGAISETLERHGGGWLTNVFGAPAVQGVSQRLAQVWQDSLVAQMERFGSVRGSVLQQQVQQQLRSARRTFEALRPDPNNPFYVMNVLQSIGKGYVGFLDAIHNAPAFNFARRNRGILPMDRLTREARNLTGDPRIGGQYWTHVPGEGVQGLRFEGGQGVGAQVAQGAARTYLILNEMGRNAVPWFNYTVQGMKRIGQAYLQNPAAFAGRVWLYTMMPAAGLYFYNRALGPEYSDYQMNRRSNYNKSMNWYIGVPGRPPEEGFEIPRFHELSIAARMMEAAMDHLTRSNVFTSQEDMAAAAKSYLSTTFMPAVPPPFAVYDATQGQVAPQGLFGDSGYQRRTEPFDQNGTGLPQSVELVGRAIWGGLADVIGASYAAFTQSEDDIVTALGQAVEAGASRAVTKAPLVRDLFNVRVPVSSDTQIAQELWRKQDAIEALIGYYKKWTKEPSAQSNAKVPGEINTAAASARGGAMIEQLLGPVTTPESPGLDQPEPTNPLYGLFMARLYDVMEKDGAMGMQSLWRRRGDYTEKLNRMRGINPGNMTRWEGEMQGRPEAIKELEEAGVDWKNPAAVRNFYVFKRQEVDMLLLTFIRQVEQEFSQELGETVRIEDLDPYGQGVGQEAGQGAGQGNVPVAEPAMMQ